MIHTLLAFWPLLAAAASLVLSLWALRRTCQRRQVQIWVGESCGGGAESPRGDLPVSEKTLPDGASSTASAGPRISGSLELPQSAQMRSAYRAAPVSSLPPVVPMDDDLREALKASLRAPEPRHFRVLRWLGIECKYRKEFPI